MGVSDYIKTLRRKVGHDLLLLPGVTALIYNDAGEVLLNHRTDNDNWSVLGGAVDPGETPAEAIVREMREEIGVEVAVDRVAGVDVTPTITYPNSDVAQYVLILFRCSIVSGVPRVADDESHAVRFFPLDQLPDSLRKDHARWILANAAPSKDQPATFV